MKLARVGAILGVYLVLGKLIRWTDRRPALVVKARLTRHASRWARRLLRAMGVEVRQVVPFPASPGASLVVANHMSYLDALVLIAVRPMVFVTSVEVNDTFFLGSMSRSAGSLFVERRSRSSVQKQIETLAEVLREGLSIVVFPEGTTSDAHRVMPFKPSLFAAAETAGVSVSPLCLRYPWMEGAPLEGRAKDVVAYYGEMEFFPHFRRLLEVKQLVAEVEPLPLLSVTSRKAVAEAAEASVRECFEKPSRVLSPRLVSSRRILRGRWWAGAVHGIL